MTKLEYWETTKIKIYNRKEGWTSLLTNGCEPKFEAAVAAVAAEGPAAEGGRIRRRRTRRKARSKKRKRTNKKKRSNKKK